jgi:hypothetical protein
VSTTFKHNGTDIELRDNGKFYAKTAAGMIEAPSLVAIKKKLDAKAKFEPFSVIFETSKWDGGFSRRVRSIGTAKVVGIYSPRAKWRGAMWQLEGSERDTGAVIEDTPENRAALQAYIDAMAHREQVVREADDAVEAARDALPWRRASEYGQQAKP